MKKFHTLFYNVTWFFRFKTHVNLHLITSKKRRNLSTLLHRHMQVKSSFQTHFSGSKSDERKMNIKRAVKLFHSFKLSAFCRQKSSLWTSNNKINAKNSDLNNSSQIFYNVNVWEKWNKRCLSVANDVENFGKNYDFITTSNNKQKFSAILTV